MDDLMRDSCEGKILDPNIVKNIARQVLVVHDPSSDIRETGKLFLEHRETLSIDLHHPIFDRLEVALYCGYRSADLVRNIGEKVGADFFLDRECFLEIIDRGDEWRKFIFPTISDRRIFFSVDDIFYIFGDDLYRTKDRTNPYKVED